MSQAIICEHALYVARSFLHFAISRQDISKNIHVFNEDNFEIIFEHDKQYLLFI